MERARLSRATGLFCHDQAPDVYSALMTPCSSATVSILDSFGEEHPEAFTVLRNYLFCEAKAHKLIPPKSTDKEMKQWFRAKISNRHVEVRGPASCVLFVKFIFHVTKVPQQPNEQDCGLFLIHFVEIFLEDPEGIAKAMVRSSFMVRLHGAL